MVSLAALAVAAGPLEAWTHGSSSIVPLYIPDLTDASIRSCAAAAAVAGGGYVLIPAGSVTLTSPLPLLSGVRYVGTDPQFTYNNSNGTFDTAWQAIGGTILVGNGTFPAFSGNATDQASPANPFTSNGLTACGVENLVINNFTYGVKCGAVNNAGCGYGSFKRLWIQNCSQWGIFLANFAHIEVDYIFTQLCQNAQYYGSLVAASVLQPGDSVLKHLFNIFPPSTWPTDNKFCRGIVFEAGVTGAILNSIETLLIEANAFDRTMYSATATLASGSANVAVPDGTKFIVGLPVSFSSTNYGFKQYQTYMVLSVNGNTLTLGNQKSGSAISATGSGSLTIQSYGMPDVEVVGRISGSLVQDSKFYGFDIEGNTTAALYLENCTNCKFDIGQLPAHANVVDICGRNASYNEIIAFCGATTDLDGASTTTAFRGVLNLALQNTGLGQFYDNAISTQGFSFMGRVDDLQERYSNGFFLAWANTTPAVATRQIGNTGVTLAGSQCGLISNTYTSGIATWALPTVTNSTASSTATQGLWFRIANTYSAYSLVINTDGTQVFNKVAAKTSTTIPAGGIMEFYARDGYWEAVLLNTTIP